MLTARFLNEPELQEIWEKVNIPHNSDLSPADVQYAILIEGYVSDDILLLLLSGRPECYEVLVEEDGVFVPIKLTEHILNPRYVEFRSKSKS